MNAIFLVSPYPAPYKTFKNIQDAEDWIEKQYQKAKEEGAIK